MSCANNSSKIFSQVVHILDQVKDEDYSAPLSILSDSTLGKHFRHILNFYKCIVLSDGKETLDYACRDRSPTMESNTDFMKSAYLNLQSEIERLDEKQEINVVSDFHNMNENERLVVMSTIGRELMYAYDHAVHHLAIIKIGIKSAFDYVDLASDVGVAPSTIKYINAQELNH